MNQSQDSQQQYEEYFNRFCESIGLPNFKEKTWIKIALLHPSFIYETTKTQEKKEVMENLYRRQAHLGDAIFSAIVTDCLFENFPDYTIAELTEGKKLLVDKSLLFQFAVQLNLPQFCFLGKSQNDKPLEGQHKLFAEMFKALVGGIYLSFDQDLSKAKTWLNNHFLEEAIEGILEDEDDEDEYDEIDGYEIGTYMTTRDYLDMMGAEDFPDYGWAPGDDD